MSKVGNEASVVTAKSKKRANFSDSFRKGQIFNAICLSWINANSMFVYDITKKLNFFSKELTILGFQL